MTDAYLTKVEIETEEGSFVLGIDELHAPLTAKNFLAYVDGNFLNDASFYRIVTLDNQPPETLHKIEVLQWGWRPPSDGIAPPLPPVPHEPTSLTGLRHLNGTLSLARKAIGTGGPGYFICIGDQPELDEGGGRNPDKAGFAAFGKVLSGTDTIKRIFARAEASEFVGKPVRVVRARRHASG